MQYIIRRFAGVFVLVSLALGYWVSPYWFLFTAFVGANLLQSGFTRWCLLENILRRAGVRTEDQSLLRTHPLVSERCHTLTTARRAAPPRPA
jgi:Protein of unknown function (DUF2892)